MIFSNLLRPLQPVSIVAALACFWMLSAPAWAQFETRAYSPFPEGAYSIATGDLNHDGKLDVAMTVINGFAVALGNGDGTFGAATMYFTQPSYSLAVADFNGDGNLDIVTADDNANPSTVSVYLGKGDGTFSTIPITSSTTNYNEFVAVGDFNGDGKPDIVVIENPHVSVLLGNGDGSFGPPSDNDSFVGVHWLTVADFNNDHKADVLATGYFGGSDSIGVFLGNGDGTLQDAILAPTEFVPYTVAAGDLNGDGKMDAILSYDLGGIGVFFGNGDGTLQSPVIYDTSGISGLAVVVADLNLDGKLDVAIPSALGMTNTVGVDVFWGNGDGSLQQAQLFAGAGGLPAVGDLNGDGLPDFALGAVFSVETMLNTGVAQFSPTSPLSFPAQLINTTSPAQTVALSNGGSTSLSIRSLQASGSFRQTNTCGTSLLPGAQCTIAVKFRPTTTGSLTGLITIEDTASSKPQFIYLLGEGTEIKLKPNSLHFGNQKVGTTSKPQVVTVSNVGATAVQFKSIFINGSNWQDFSETSSCSARQLQPGASCTVSVTFAPLRSGSLSAALYLQQKSQPTASPQPVSLSGTGD